MIDLARHSSGEYVRLKEISVRQEITLKYMEQIMPLLTKAGYVKGYRGNNGGYRLTREPENYTAGEILRTTEGNLAPVACLKNMPNQCKRKDDCATLAFWEGLGKVIDDYVDSVTLADLLSGNIFPGLLDKKRNEEYTTGK